MGNTPSENEKKEMVSKKGRHECPKCRRSYEKKYDLRMHKEICGLPPHLQCEFCNYRASYRRNMKHHLKSAHMDIIKKPETLELIVMEIMKRGRKQRIKYLEALEDGTHGFENKSRYVAERVIQHCFQCGVNLEEPNLKNFCPICDTRLSYECQGCNRFHKTMPAVRSHVLYKCFPRLMYNCDFCEFSTAKKTTLKDHISSKHMKVSPEDFYTCQRCNTKIKHRNNLHRHQRYCGKEVEFFTCAICLRRIKYKVNFERHMHRHMLKADCNFVKILKQENCTGDVDENKYYVKLDKEEKIVNVDENKNIVKSEITEYLVAYCQSCQNKVKWKHRVTRCRSCSSKLVFRCGAENCTKEFPKQSDLYNHAYNIHSSIDLSKVQCSKCLKTFINSEQLQTHQRHTCDKEPHLKCDFCPYKSKRKFNLTSHINRMHSQDDSQGPIQCETCGKLYKTGASYSRHQAYCGDNAPDIECSLCAGEYRTKVKYCMLEHVRTKHVEQLVTGERSTRCERCFRDIRNVYLYEKHLEICSKDDDNPAPTVVATCS